MADTYKKTETLADTSGEDGWKEVVVEKSHQPEKVKSTLTYLMMERQVEDIDNQITSLAEQKTVLEAEMVKVKAAAEA